MFLLKFSFSPVLVTVLEFGEGGTTPFSSRYPLLWALPPRAAPAAAGGVDIVRKSGVFTIGVAKLVHEIVNCHSLL